MKYDWNTGMGPYLSTYKQERQGDSSFLLSKQRLKFLDERIWWWIRPLAAKLFYQWVTWWLDSLSSFCACFKRHKNNPGNWFMCFQCHWFLKQLQSLTVECQNNLIGYTKHQVKLATACNNKGRGKESPYGIIDSRGHKWYIGGVVNEIVGDHSLYNVVLYYAYRHTQHTGDSYTLLYMHLVYCRLTVYCAVKPSGKLVS